MTSSPDQKFAQRGGRIDFIDAQRGIAVALMIWMHTADGWLRPELKHGPAWEAIRSLGGLAAPAFFFLAGLGLGLDWGRPNAAPRSVANGIARGLQLMLLGYALRLQMWMLDAGGLGSARAWLAAIPLGAGYFAVYRTLELCSRPPVTPPNDESRTGRDVAGADARQLKARPATLATRWALLGLAGSALGLTLVAALIPDRLRPLLRVDALQGVGASLALVALLRPLLGRAAAGWVAVGALVALATPWMRALMPWILPTPLASYVASWELAVGATSPSLFPLFPWLAYVPLGLVAGMSMAGQQDHQARRKALTWALGGLVLALTLCEPLPLAKAVLARCPWLIQFDRVGYRVGVVLVFGALALGLSHRKVRLAGPLVTMGRASLFVYWVHLELAFGVLSRPFARKLGLSGWFLGFVLLFGLMVLLARLWLEFKRRFSAGSGSSPFATGRASHSSAYAGR